MPEYLAPGVYVEEIPSAVKPIAGVGTSTAGFVGVVTDDVKMPLKPGKKKENAAPEDYYKLAEANKPQPINNFEEFRTKFGEDFEENKNEILAHSVYGFFNNGGSRCWVNRVASINDVEKAIDDFEAIDEIAIVAAPVPLFNGEADDAALTAIHAKLAAHCNRMEDRVAILDCARDIKDDNLVITADGTGIHRPATDDKGYVSFFFPYIQVSDLKSTAKAGDRIFVPPSGHMAGIYGRSDRLRGVHKAPANEVILGTLGVRYRVGKILQGSLNPSGINCIRPFNTTIKVYGARTLAYDPQGGGNQEWIYTNVRRLFNYLRESIDEGTQWVVFEPNSPDLWAKITRNITAFLTTVWRSGALFGITAQEAFYVKCDAETNPPEVRDLGQVVTEIGVAPVKPAEFVIFRISQWTGPGK
ncbi:MAG: phage tail sheath subtilisin-like domain-containing protein [Anaerolineae bacterium]|nr:phage tail sheath subtilisin-like domain-containing protein [Anaerolineae bacterium]